MRKKSFNMFDVNNYFEGKVTSLAFTEADGPATVGVMAPGEYEFGTSKKEYMTVVSGALTILLPEASEWKTFGEGETFEVEANQKFGVKVEVDTAYLCRYR